MKATKLVWRGLKKPVFLPKNNGKKTIFKRFDMVFGGLVSYPGRPWLALAGRGWPRQAMAGLG